MKTLETACAEFLKAAEAHKAAYQKQKQYESEVAVLFENLVAARQVLVQVVAEGMPLTPTLSETDRDRLLAALAAKKPVVEPLAENLCRYLIGGVPCDLLRGHVGPHSIMTRTQRDYSLPTDESPTYGDIPAESAEKLREQLIENRPPHPRWPRMGS